MLFVSNCLYHKVNEKKLFAHHGHYLVMLIKIYNIFDVYRIKLLLNVYDLNKLFFKKCSQVKHNKRVRKSGVYDLN